MDDALRRQWAISTARAIVQDFARMGMEAPQVTSDVFGHNPPSILLSMRGVGIKVSTVTDYEDTMWYTIESPVFTIKSQSWTPAMTKAATDALSYYIMLREVAHG